MKLFGKRLGWGMKLWLAAWLLMFPIMLLGEVYRGAVAVLSLRGAPGFGGSADLEHPRRAEQEARRHRNYVGRRNAAEVRSWLSDRFRRELASVRATWRAAGFKRDGRSPKSSLRLKLARSGQSHAREKQAKLCGEGTVRQLSKETSRRFAELVFSVFGLAEFALS